jgi:SHS2 domain-containing protein
MKYEFLEHTADIKIRTYGCNLEEAFENVILAFSDFVSGGEGVKPRKGKVVNVSGNDKESLLYNFIEELIYLLDAEKFVVAKGSVFFRGNNLRAELFGDDAINYNELENVKAATYAEMEIKQKDDKKWVLTMVVDV